MDRNVEKVAEIVENVDATAENLDEIVENFENYLNVEDEDFIGNSSEEVSKADTSHRVLTPDLSDAPASPRAQPSSSSNVDNLPKSPEEKKEPEADDVFNQDSESVIDAMTAIEVSPTVVFPLCVTMEKADLTEEELEQRRKITLIINEMIPPDYRLVNPGKTAPVDFDSSGEHCYVPPVPKVQRTKSQVLRDVFSLNTLRKSLSRRKRSSSGESKSTDSTPVKKESSFSFKSSTPGKKDNVPVKDSTPGKKDKVTIKDSTPAKSDVASPVTSPERKSSISDELLDDMLKMIQSYNENHDEADTEIVEELLPFVKELRAKLGAKSRRSSKE